MKKIKNVVLVVVIAAFSAYTVYSNRKTVELMDLTLWEVEALANNGETIDGGTLPGFGVTCDAGNSGKCFKVSYQEGLYDKCWFYCSFTGYQSDYCSAWYVGLVNVCTISGGIYSLDKDV